MGLALRETEYRAFTLHIRCTNCMRPTTRGLTFPVCADMPTDADELAESALLGNMKFRCGYCEGMIGQLFNVTTGG